MYRSTPSARGSLVLVAVILLLVLPFAGAIGMMPRDVWASDEATPEAEDGVIVEVDEGEIWHAGVGCDGMETTTQLPAWSRPPVVLLLRISFEPGARMTLPNMVGVVCQESGQITVDETPMVEWGLMPTDLGAEQTFTASAEVASSLIVVLISPDARRLSVPDNVRVEQLGSGTPMNFGAGPVEILFERYSLGEGDKIRKDPGRDGVAIVAVERGRVRHEQQSGGSTAASHAPNGELTWWQGSVEGADDEVLIAGDTIFFDQAQFGLFGEPGENAELAILTVSPNAAALQGVEFGGPTPTADAATPAGQASPVAAASCDTPPLTQETFDRWFGTPISNEEGQAIFDRPIWGPKDGVPADATTTAAIEETMRGLAACTNAADGPRVVAFFSFAVLAMYFVFDDSSYESFVSDLSFSDEDDAGAPIVWDVRLQTDGRVTAKVEQDSEAALYTFVHDQGRWLIDDVNASAIIEPAPQS